MSIVKIGNFVSLFKILGVHANEEMYLHIHGQLPQQYAEIVCGDEHTTKATRNNRHNTQLRSSKKNTALKQTLNGPNKP